ncbi:MAG: NADH-ubiquinone oxidoreductase-F iron-sulfur binding region domain-containing protein, partial [Acidimicrobiales bacterium]
IEVACGALLSELVRQAGGSTEAIQAFLIGGYGGAWLPAETVRNAPLCESALRGLGGTMGAAVILALPADACGITETARIASYLADETAGQCGPCANGLPALSQGLNDLARGTVRRDVVERLKAWVWQVSERGACHHPDGVARLVTSALRTFSADVDAHAKRRPCAAARRTNSSARALSR